MGRGVAEVGGCEGDARRLGVGCGELCSDEHDKREKANVILNRKILVFTFKRLLIKLLLTDGILQHA